MASLQSAFSKMLLSKIAPAKSPFDKSQPLNTQFSYPQVAAIVREN